MKINSVFVLVVIFAAGVGIVYGDIFDITGRVPVDPVDVGDDVDQNTGGDDTDTDTDTNPQEATAGAFELLAWQTYNDEFVLSDGRVISTQLGILCENAGVGCGTQTTSEGVARTAWIAAALKDKEVFDARVKYIDECMQHPNGKYLMWNRDENCNSAGGGGSNSANDADLIMINALRIAIEDNGWTTSEGVDLRSLQRELMDALKPAVVDGFLTHCTTYFSDRDTPESECEPRGFIGYVELHVLKYMKGVDSYWSSVYDRNVDIHIESIQNGGFKDTYYPLEDRYTNERGDTESMWQLRNLVEDGSDKAWQAVRGIYEPERDRFLASGKEEICKQFTPGTGCILANADFRIYGFWLDAASARVRFGSDPADEQFRDRLVDILKSKIRYAGPQPMIASGYQYENTVILEALREAERSGGNVGGTIA